jgi:hypothetical protein
MRRLGRVGFGPVDGNATSAMAMGARAGLMQISAAVRARAVWVTG